MPSDPPWRPCRPKSSSRYEEAEGDQIDLSSREMDNCTPPDQIQKRDKTEEEEDRRKKLRKTPLPMVQTDIFDLAMYLIRSGASLVFFMIWSAASSMPTPLAIMVSISPIVSSSTMKYSSMSFL